MAQPDPEQTPSSPTTPHEDPTARAPMSGDDPFSELDADLYDEELGVYQEADEDNQPAEWYDEQGRRHLRRAAPEGTEEILEKEVARETALPDRLERWRQRSATGAVVTAFALGLQAALDTQREEPAIVMETSGEPPTDLPVEAQLEQLGPRQSTVKVRTWLYAGDQQNDVQGTPSELSPGGAGGANGSPAASANGGLEGEAGPE